jgi:putative phosphonate metabolism protein
MRDFIRYAVYAAPKPGPLADFAAAWLGWDPTTGQTRAHPDLEGLPRPVAELTAAARKYGFHGTLKPPFKLAGGATRAGLECDLADLAGRIAPVEFDALSLARIGGFLALTPGGDTLALNRLAGRAVTELDHNRAPASEAELARRRKAGLTAQQEKHLLRWGYPYVLDEFRFHFTLTGKLDAQVADATEQVLAPLLQPLIPHPFILDDLCLFGEDDQGMFHLLHRYALTG